MGAIPIGLQGFSDYANYLMTTQQKQITNTTAAVQTTKKVVEEVKKVATAPFDIFVFIKANWQLVTVGVIALLVILKD